MSLWEDEITPHDRAAKTVRAYLSKKYKIKAKVESSVGTRRIPDVSGYDEAKRIWYICEVKARRSDLDKVWTQIEVNRNFITKRSKKDKVICFVGVTQRLYEKMRKNVGYWEDFKKRMTNSNIKILVVRKTTVKPA